MHHNGLAKVSCLKYPLLFKLNDMSKTEHTSDNHEQGNSSLGVVSGSAIKPPLGLMPNKFYDERVKVERFNEVCGAIARYYDAGMKINIE
jgi:hypothetical protein